MTSPFSVCEYSEINESSIVNSVTLENAYKHHRFQVKLPTYLQPELPTSCASQRQNRAKRTTKMHKKPIICTILLGPFFQWAPSLSPDIIRDEWPKSGTLQGQIWERHRLILMLNKWVELKRHCPILKQGQLQGQWCWKLRPNCIFFTPIKFKGRMVKMSP